MQKSHTCILYKMKRDISNTALLTGLPLHCEMESLYFRLGLQAVSFVVVYLSTWGTLLSSGSSVDLVALHQQIFPTPIKVPPKHLF